MKMFILIRGHFEHVQHVRMDKEEKFGDRNTKLCSIPKHLNVLKYKIVKRFEFAQDFLRIYQFLFCLGPNSGIPNFGSVAYSYSMRQPSRCIQDFISLELAFFF